MVNYNAITYDRLKSFGLDPINSAADRSLLVSSLSSPAAAARGFNTPPYPGFPLSQTVFQSLRLFPQFTTIPVAYDPLGKTWYNSLQVKLTQRFSHGLSAGTTKPSSGEVQVSSTIRKRAGGGLASALSLETAAASSFSTPLF